MKLNEVYTAYDLLINTAKSRGQEVRVSMQCNEADQWTIRIETRPANTRKGWGWFS